MQETQPWKEKIRLLDERHKLLIGGDKSETIDLCVQAFISVANEAIKSRGAFYVALSGGSTPKAVFENLSSEKYKNQIDWTKVFVFWGDERAVPPTDIESNYRMAVGAGLGQLPIPKKHIFRMKGEGDIEENALAYEKEVRKHVPDQCFDLILLGMGPDGHTASLFPHTHGLQAHEDRLVIGNFVSQKDTWRMTFTQHLINRARNIHIYILGANKAETLVSVLRGPFQPDLFPIQKIGTEDNPALWILDNDAAQAL